MQIKKILFYLGQAFISICLVFILSEIFIRLLAPKYLYEFRDAAADWALDNTLGWVNKPNLNTTFVTDDGGLVYFRTNQDGLIPGSAKRPKAPGVKRIMIFGDSVVVGRAVAENQRINSFLEIMLQRRGFPVEVICAGVQGYSTDQSALLMERLLPLYRPDIVIYGFFRNDLAGNVVRNNYGIAKPMFIQQGDGSLGVLPVVRHVNFKIPTFRESSPKKWIQYSASYRFLRPHIITLRAKLGRWQDRNLLGLPEEYYWNEQALNKANWPIFISLLKRMKTCALSHNAHFLFYSFPELAEVWDPYIFSIIKSNNLKNADYDRYTLENKMIEISRENDINFCPLIGFFIKNQHRGPFHLLPRDSHSNGMGYEVTSEALAEYIVEAKFLDISP